MEEADKKNAEMSDDEKTKNGTFLVVGKRGGEEDDQDQTGGGRAPDEEDGTAIEPGSGKRTENRRKCFNVLYSNAHSVCNKIDELRCYVSENAPDFILINEAWTNGSVTDAF